MDHERQFCNGIVLQYDDGMVKHLGQCRLGVDTMKCIQRPEYICYAAAEYRALSPGCTYKGVMVEFSRCGHAHDTQMGTTWICHKMSGMAEFWFSRNTSELVITEE